jgi:hypothetical protein
MVTNYKLQTKYSVSDKEYSFQLERINNKVVDYRATCYGFSKLEEMRVYLPEGFQDADLNKFLVAEFSYKYTY